MLWRTENATCVDCVILRLILSFGRRQWTTLCPARDRRSDHRSVAVDCQGAPLGDGRGSFCLLRQG